ncbi:MAG: glucose 1-dehydrogenase [Desulfarculales bacterium]|jgi:2-deoxy-D-gluconate 3-dehydrogenase|nr:glucose 1-dehydrogenase [Desulfarculales bacterium]
MKFPSADLSGKVALVTGGSKGIGFGMAEALAHAGADLIIASRNLEQCRIAAEHMKKIKGNRAIAISCDVTSSQSVNSMVDEAVKELGGINILVNNAGMNIRNPVVKVSDSDWQTVINTNLTGMFYVARKVGDQMIKQGKKGKIINIASVYSAVASENVVSYTTTKSAVVNMTKAMALEWAKYDINCNAISPAYILTELTAKLVNDKDTYEWMMRMTPLKRLGSLEDLAGPVVFLASDWANYITGHNLLVDGGWTAQ